MIPVFPAFIRPVTGITGRLKSVFPLNHIDFTTSWLLRAPTLQQLQPVTLPHSETPESGEKEGDRVDFFKWKWSTFFLCGPTMCVDIYLTCHVIAGRAKQPGHPAADSRAMFELHAVPTLLLFMCAVIALTFESFPCCAPRYRLKFWKISDAN